MNSNQPLIWKWRPIRLTFCLLVCFLFNQQLHSQNVSVNGALSGNGSYPDLNSAFVAINSGAQTAANITVNIIANTTETTSAVLNSGAWSSVSITPSGGVMRTITGAIAGPLIDLNGADNVFINGINTGGNALTISNTDVGNLSTSTIRLASDATNNTINNCTILGSSTSATLGVILFSSASVSGNSSNMIIGCNIGPAGVDLPVNGIYSIGSVGFDNINNTIMSCNIYDFFSATLSSSGILISSNNSAWIIINNKIYQTGLRTYTSANTHNGIKLTSGNNHLVLNNTIGYESSAATGVYSMAGTIASRFIGIDLAIGTATTSSIQGNTITAITLTTSSTAATANGVIAGINITAGNATISNNLIGGTLGADLITSNQTASGGLVVGINSSSTGTITISNNYCGGLTTTGITAAVTGWVNGINISGLSTLLTITSNTVGNPTPNNMRSGTNGLTTAASFGNGIYLASSIASTGATISNNLVQNFSNYGTGNGILRGIAGMGGTGGVSITSNTITGFYTNAGNATVTNGIICLAGIQFSTGTSYSITNNTIFNLLNNSASTGLVIAGGISIGSSTNPYIANNRIYDIKNTSPGGITATTRPVACGIFIRSATTSITIFNNMISLGTGQTSSTAFVGIWGNHGSTPNPTVNIYYNTINIEGIVVTGDRPTVGIMRGDFSATARIAPYDIRNNIITNSRTGGVGPHIAIANNLGATASITGWGLNASNHNVLNADPTTVGYWTTAQNFSGWQTASNGDGNSYSGINITYSNSANDLHLNMGLTPTNVESGGQVIAGFINDFDNQVRPGPAGSVNGGGLSPDIGADEIDGALVTCTTASGGTITPASGTACSGQTVIATSMSVSTGLGTLYQWMVGATPGGPYINVSGGSGATTPSYTSAPLTSGIYYVVLRTSCPAASLISVSNEVTLTVINSPTVSSSSTTTLICSGQSLSLTGTPGTGTIQSWTGPNGFVSSSQNTVITNAPTSASGSYSFVSAVGTCTSIPSIVSVTVNATPTTLTLSPISTSLCSGDQQTLNVIGGPVASVLNFTPQANQNSATTYPAPYSVYYGGQRMQILILASELTAAGFIAGPLTSIQFPVVSLGANWGNTLNDCQSFQVSVGHTALNAVTGTFQGGLTIVSPVSNFTPSVGYNNLHNFSTPFVWNGTSNIIVETVFSNNLVGSAADGVIQYNSPTLFQSTMVYRADSQPFATIAAASTTNIATSFIRPDFILKGLTAATYSWSPSSGLSTTSGSSVVASPLNTTIYTVQATIGNCSTNTSGTVEVTPLPTVSIVSTSSAVCSGESATLSASGATSYTWSTLSNATSIVVAPAQTTIFTVSNQTGPCPVVTESVNLVVNQSPTVVASSSHSSICIGESATLTASGASSYSWSAGSTNSTQTVQPTSNTVYTVTGTDFGCSASTTIAVVSNSLPIVLVSPLSASACMLSQTTFTASGANTYSWSTGNQTAVLTITANANTIYTVIGTSSEGCGSSQTVALTVFALPVIVISPASSTICIGEEISLTASGANTYTWFPNNTSTVSLLVSPIVNTTYSITGTDSNNCENSSAVSIVVDECVGINNNTDIRNQISVYPNPTSGYISVKFEFEGEKEISIMNSVGALIEKFSSINYYENIDLSSKSKGIYYIKVSTKTASANFRIIVQ